MGRPNNCRACNRPKRPNGKRFAKRKGYCTCGRNTKMTEKTLKKLERGFMLGLSDEKSCKYAEISTTTLYNYQKQNPEFKEKKDWLKETPDIIAKETVIKSLETDLNSAWKWVERRDPTLVPKSKNENKSTVKIESNLDPNDMSEEEHEALKKLREARRKRLEQKVKEMDS